MSGLKQWINVVIDALDPLGSKLLRISRMWKGLMHHRAASRNSSAGFVNLYIPTGKCRFLSYLLLWSSIKQRKHTLMMEQILYNTVHMQISSNTILFEHKTLAQLFREPFTCTSFRRLLRVMFFQNERSGCDSVPWQVFRGSFVSLSPRCKLLWNMWKRLLHLSCECVLRTSILKALMGFCLALL